MIVLQQDSNETKTKVDVIEALTDSAVRACKAWSTFTAVPVVSVHTSATVVTIKREVITL